MQTQTIYKTLKSNYIAFYFTLEYHFYRCYNVVR